MFLGAQQMWSIPKTPEGKKDFDKIRRKIAREEEKAWQGLKNEFEPLLKLDEPVSETPDGGHAVYQMNDTFIELRTPFDEKRGGITFAAGCFLAAPVGVGVPMAFTLLIPSIISGTYPGNGNELGWRATFQYFSVLY